MEEDELTVVRDAKQGRTEDWMVMSRGDHLIKASVAQEGLYVAWMMEAEPKNVYTFTCGFDCSVALSSSLVLCTLVRLTEVHSALRTHFVQVNSVVFQYVHDATVPVFDHFVLDSSEDILVSEWFESQRRFDLNCAPLMAVFLLETCDLSRLNFSLAHIIFDWGASDRLFGDFLSIYNFCCYGKVHQVLRPTRLDEFCGLGERRLEIIRRRSESVLGKGNFGSKFCVT